MLGILLALSLVHLDDPPAPIKKYASLKAEYDAAELAWDQRFQSPEMSDPKKIGAISRYRDWPAWDYAPKFLAIAEADPTGQDAFDSLLWIVKLGRQVGTGDRLVFTIHAKAMEMLEKHYLDDPRLKESALDLARSTLSPAWEHFAREVSENAKDREMRGMMTLELGIMLNNKVTIRKGLWFDKPGTPFQSFLVTRFDPAYVAYIRKCDIEKAYAESEAVLKKARDDYGDVEFRMQTIAAIADRSLAEQKAKKDGR